MCPLDNINRPAKNVKYLEKCIRFHALWVFVFRTWNNDNLQHNSNNSRNDFFKTYDLHNFCLLPEHLKSHRAKEPSLEPETMRSNRMYEYQHMRM